MRQIHIPRAAKATILVIDEDPLLLTLVAALLHNAGHECHCARNGEAALKAVRSLALDLLIADLDLASDDGLALCQELKAEPNAADVPLMVVSGSQIPNVVERVRELGGAYYLRKPFDPEVLLELVDKALWMPHLVGAQMTAKETVKPSFSFRSTFQTLEAR